MTLSELVVYFSGEIAVSISVPVLSRDKRGGWSSQHSASLDFSETDSNDGSRRGKSVSCLPHGDLVTKEYIPLSCHTNNTYIVKFSKLLKYMLSTFSYYHYEEYLALIRP